jgi:peptidoglycan L-alanyl-D-glutamate endopeptidase CwlK
MTYVIGVRSHGFLNGVDPKLIAVAERAIAISDQDFGFTEPQLRTLAEEKAKVAAGTSHSLHSHHLPQASGFGGAIDAVPWNGTAFVWEWPRIYMIAAAFRQASAELATPITWGGCWDRLMSELDGDGPLDMKAAVTAYALRMKAKGNLHPLLDVLDGPHFELGRN